MTTKQKQNFAITIAHFLSELHGLLDVTEAAAVGLHSPEDPLSSWQLRQQLLPLLEQSQHIFFVEQVLDSYEQIESTPETAVFLHGDLHGWNIALDPASNQLVGVFDFNGTCIGDPVNPNMKLVKNTLIILVAFSFLIFFVRGSSRFTGQTSSLSPETSVTDLTRIIILPSPV